MSVNVSLSDTPGVSAYFDGQPIQDQVEEEVRREEERQEKELRDLLASELEDFEDDFLSESNSDEDSINVSQASNSHTRTLRGHTDKKAHPTHPNYGKASADKVDSDQHAASVQPMPTAALEDDWMMKIQTSSGNMTSPFPNAFHRSDYPFSNEEVYPSDTNHMVSHTPSAVKARVANIPHQDGNVPQYYQISDHFSPSQNIPVATPVEHSVAAPLPLSAPIKVNGDTNEYTGYQVQYNAAVKQDNISEEYFYLGNKNADFFLKDGPEEKRTYAQLEILYRARGRELEDIKWKVDKQKDESAKEIRILKHKLAVATGESEGAQESLKQCQMLLQQSKSDLADSSGQVRALETQISSLTGVKEELLKKLQIGESTIENLSHQVQELHDTESLSRARNEHEAVVSSLSQRYEREILSLKEKLDETNTNLSVKNDEFGRLKKQFSDSSKELEHAQISRAETINRLTKSLEDSQRQCQSLLERASGHEVASLRVQLQQTIASKDMSEEMCTSYQTELKDLKEQLNMFESASALGAVATTAGGASTHAGLSLDDSMTDLGIKKTLDFGTPHSTSNVEGTSSSDDLVSSLRSELERCLRSNKQKRQEIAEKKEELNSVKHELQTARDKLQELEKTCVNQKNRLDELDSLMSSQDNVGIVEAKFKRDIQNLKRDRSLLMEDLEDHEKRLEELGASEARVTEINTELSQQIAQMVGDFDADKCAALERSQRTLEEVHRITMDNLRSEMESRLESEKAMMTTSHKTETENLRKKLASIEQEIDEVKSLYIKTCEERSDGEQELRDKIQTELRNEVMEIERKHVLAEEEFQTERKAWAEKENGYDIEINSLNSKIDELKISYENAEEELQQLLNTQIEKLNEEWKVKVDALTETLSEKQKEKERIIKEKQFVIEEMEKMKVSKCEIENKSEGAVSYSEGKLLIDTAVQTACEVNEKQSSECQRMQKDINNETFSASNKEHEIERLKVQHAQEIEAIKNEHRKEFENAARKREEKFQTELRYFLKEKEDKAKEKLEIAVREQRDKWNMELNEKLKKLDTEHRLELQQLESELKETQMSTNIQVQGDMKESKEMQLVDVNEMSEENEMLNRERKLLVEKIDKAERQKKAEMDDLIEKHDIELKKLQEKFIQQMRELKLQFEGNPNHEEKIVKGSEEMLKDSSKLEVIMTKKMEEERAICFMEAQSYVRNEIAKAVKARREELQKKFEADSRLLQKQQKNIEEEIRNRVEKCVEEEMRKIQATEESREFGREINIEGRVKRKVQAEVENLKTKFLSELNSRVAKEKSRLEQDLKNWKEETKKRIEEEKENFAQSMIQDTERKLSDEKENMIKQKEEEIKNIRQEMKNEMYRQIQTEKDKMKMENEWKIKNGEDHEKVSNLRERLQSEVTARTKVCSERDKAVQFLTQREKIFKEEKQKLLSGLKECRDKLNAMKEEHVALEEKCSQMERKYKTDMREAKKKRESALSQLSSKLNEEKENLILSFKSHITAMNEEFTQELEKVRHECEMEKASALIEVRSHAERALTISPMQEPDLEATTLFELRDHYLETVKKIKDDVMNHVQAANSRAASTLKTEMQKQKIKLIKTFKEKCKSSIRSFLSGQVSVNCINSLEHAIDVISETLVTTPSAIVTSKALASTARSDTGAKNHPSSAMIDTESKEEMISRQNSGESPSIVDVDRSKREMKRIHCFGSSPEFAHIKRKDKAASRQKRKEAQHHQGHNDTFSQLAKVDLYDSGSLIHSPENSNQSSPASNRDFKSLSRKSPLTLQGSQEFHIPPLDLSSVDETLPQNQENFHQKENLQSMGNMGSIGKTYSAEGPHQETDNSHHIDNRRVDSPSVWGHPSRTHGLREEKSHLVSDEEVNASPRERLKMIEARVRLANWASSGEMPWKSTDEEDENSRKRLERTENSSAVYKIYDQPQEHLSSKHCKPVSLNRDQEDTATLHFVRPGKEADDFIKSMKKYKRSEYERNAHLKPNRDYRYTALDGYVTDDSSNDSHASLVTLEPDTALTSYDVKCPKHVPQKEMVGSSDDDLKNKIDYDRIKAAVLNKESHNPSKLLEPNVMESDFRKMGFDSDSETDSSSLSSQNFVPLPTSTPAKKVASQLHKPVVADSLIHEISSKMAVNPIPSSEKHTYSTQEDWKTIKVFTDSGIGSSSHQASTNGTRRKLDIKTPSNLKDTDSSHNHRSRSVERPKHGQRTVGKLPDPVVPLDRSSIPWTSDDHYEGVGMWRYKSLEDILASMNVGEIKDSPSIQRPDIAHASVGSQSDTRRHKMRNVNEENRTFQRADPVQAMNSDFWARLTREDHDGDNDGDRDWRVDSNYAHMELNRNPKNSKRHEVARRKLRDEEVMDKHLYSTPTDRSNFSQQPAFSSEPRHVSNVKQKSYGNKTKSFPVFAQETSFTSLPRSFATHVNDVRKSLEAMENMPFTHSFSEKKGKMKRSTSEQSLHLLRWDQDSSLATTFDKYQPQTDIDDLISVYSKAPVTQSHFDLHTFGTDSMF